MYLTVGIVITASVLLAVLPGINSSTCTSYAALSEPCGCTISKDNLDPLCGSDGGTYLNECFLECEKTLSNVDIRIDHKGMCQGDARCSCHPRYEPVCASNGVTYSNDCVLQCNIRKDPSIRLNHKGECQSDAPSRTLSKPTLKTCTCNPASGPMCATNDVTYPNYCVMSCYSDALNDSSIDFAYWGVCNPEDTLKFKESTTKNCKETPSKQYDSPAGNDYYHGDEGDEASKLKEPQGTKSRCTCAAVHKPVCASNQKTYPNVCVLHCYAKKDSKIKFLKMGDCSSEPARLVSRYWGVDDKPSLRVQRARRADRRNSRQRWRRHDKSDN